MLPTLTSSGCSRDLPFSRRASTSRSTTSSRASRSTCSRFVYPHYLAPRPRWGSCSSSPTWRNVLAQGFEVPRGTSLRSVLGRGGSDGLRISDRSRRHALAAGDRARRIHRATWATSATSRPFVVPERRCGHGSARRQDCKISELNLDELTLFLRGSDELPSRLYEQLLGHVLGVMVRPAARPIPWQHLIVDEPIAAVGFRGRRGAAPLRAAFVPRVPAAPGVLCVFVPLFVCEAGSCSGGMRRCTRSEVGDRVRPSDTRTSLERRGQRAELRAPLHSGREPVPASGRPDPSHRVDPRVSRHPRPNAADGLRGPLGDRSGWARIERRGQAALSSVLCVERPDRGAGKTLPTTPSSGSPALSRPASAPGVRDRATWGARCSCRSWTRTKDRTVRHSDSSRWRLSAPTEICRCISRSGRGGATSRSTQVRRSSGFVAYRDRRPARRPMPWGRELATHQPSLIELSVAGGSRATGPGRKRRRALRELLSLYADLTNTGARKQIDGLREAASAGVTRALPVAGPTTFGRGMEITLACNEAAFEGAGVFLFGAVLERFLAKYVSINSFTETVLKTAQRGEIMRWRRERDDGQSSDRRRSRRHK